MRKLLVSLAACACLLAASCAHNASMLGAGTAFSIGSSQVNLHYADGLFLTNVSRENVRFSADLDSTLGVTYDPTTGSYKGIKGITYEIGPQLGGYAQELGEKNPEALKAYFDALKAYYESRSVQPAPQPVISDEKSKAATTSISDTVKKAIEKAKSYIDGKGDSVKKFECDGNCSYEDLSGDRDIDYQLSIAMKLLTYDGYAHKVESTGEYLTTTVEHFITQLVAYKAKGHETTPLRFKRVVVKDKVIEAATYVLDDNGEDVDVECPSCVTLED